MRPGSSAVRRALLAAAAVAASTCAPLAAQARPAAIAFTSPDGSRFVLVPDADVPRVHWVVATFAGPAEDPRGLAGLCAATLHASLNGTREIGSLDPGAEIEALEALDAAHADLIATPGDPAILQRIADCQARVDRLGDATVFARLLAAAPAHSPRVVVRDPVAVLQLTTLPGALAEVGALLVDRREHPILRGLPAAWVSEAKARLAETAGHALGAVHAEVLALAMPDHPLVAPDRLGRSAPRRAQALAVWNATQHPSRTVHVLLGDFDPAAARAVIDRTFAATSLPAPPPPSPVLAQPIRGQRRSAVPGTGQSLVALAWALPAGADPFTLGAAAAWFADGPVSQLARALAKEGRQSATVACRAPWPVELAGQSLFLVEVRDPEGIDGLADLVLAACRDLTAEVPPQSSLYATAMQLQREWAAVTADPQRLAAELARDALLRPGRAPALTRPLLVPAKDVQTLLRGVFAGHAVVVEARP